MGLMPTKSYEEFMKKDLIKPLKREGLYHQIKLPLRTNWALKTNKNCPKRENLPKFQQFKNYFFYNVDKDEKEKYRKFFLPSDHLAIRYPDKNISQSQSFPFLEMKAKFNPQSITKSNWEPSVSQLSMSNNSSVSYNIINNQKNDLYLRPSSSMKKINFKKIGVGHYADISHPFYPNFNKEFNQAFSNNNNIFKAYKGIFTKMYDDSSRNGNIYLPFDTKKNREINNSKSVIIN